MPITAYGMSLNGLLRWWFGRRNPPPPPPPPANISPTASFSSSVADNTATFSAAASTDPDGTLVSYVWDFGDNSPTFTSASTAASHTYAGPGTYSVTLTVRDDDGATGNTTRSVTIAGPAPNQPPTASFTSSVQGLTVSVNGTTSSDPEGAIQSYLWNWGDGTANSSGSTASHNYASAGTRTITLTVTDAGALTNSTSRSVTTTAPPVTDSFVLGTTKPGASNTGAGVSGNVYSSTSTSGGAFRSRTLPTASNTAAPTSGTVTLSTAGQVWEGRNHTGTVLIRASNVTVRDSIIKGRISIESTNANVDNVIVKLPGSGTGEAIASNSATLNAVVQFCTVTADAGIVPHGWNGIGRRGMVAYRCNVSNVVDGCTIAGATGTEDLQFSLLGCYIHHLAQWRPEPVGAMRPETHNDDIQFHLGANGVIRGNTLEATNSTTTGTQPPYSPQREMAAIMINGTTNVRNLTIDQNWIDWGVYAINGGGAAGSTGLVITRNKFGRNMQQNSGGEYAIMLASTAGATVPSSTSDPQRNTFEDDGTIVLRRNA